MEAFSWVPPYLVLVTDKLDVFKMEVKDLAILSLFVESVRNNEYAEYSFGKTCSFYCGDEMLIYVHHKKEFATCFPRKLALFVLEQAQTWLKKD
jgi:hypothetical protein